MTISRLGNQLPDAGQPGRDFCQRYQYPGSNLAHHELGFEGDPTLEQTGNQILQNDGAINVIGTTGGGTTQANFIAGRSKPGQSPAAAIWTLHRQCPL